MRQLCTYCKRDHAECPSLEKAGFNVAFDLEAYEPGGCGRCGGSGYKGRTGLYEVMVLSDEIRDLTVERASAEDIRKIASRRVRRCVWTASRRSRTESRP